MMKVRRKNEDFSFLVAIKVVPSFNLLEWMTDSSKSSSSKKKDALPSVALLRDHRVKNKNEKCGVRWLYCTLTNIAVPASPVMAVYKHVTGRRLMEAAIQKHEYLESKKQTAGDDDDEIKKSASTKKKKQQK
jgi:hypothetical protein